MVSKKMKYASIAGIGLMSMGLVACANPDEQQGYIGDSFETQQAMQSNGIQTIEQTQFAEKCEEYELQPDGSYMCETDDDNDSGGGVAGMFWFFNGHTYTSQSAMVNSSDYKSKNLKTGTSIPTETKNKINNPSKDVRVESKNNSKTNSKSNTSGSNNSKSGSSSKGSSGFGSGARGGSSGGS